MTSQALHKKNAGPIFDSQYAILSAPVRHVLMMGTVWYLAAERKGQPLDILEIGSWYGASALSWAQGLSLHNKASGSLTCVDAWQPFFDRTLHNNDVYNAMEKVLESDEAYNTFCHNIATVPASILTTCHRDKSENVLPGMNKASFDIVFIDADHTYDPVKQDILLCMPLVKDGGIICGDDLNLQLSQCNKDFTLQNKQKDLVKDPASGRNFHPGVTMAVHEIFGEVSVWAGFWAMQKRGNEWKRFSLEGMPINYPAHFPPEAIERAKSHLADISPVK